jgi:hypothetical protein
MLVLYIKQERKVKMENEFVLVVSNCVLLFLWASTSFIVGHTLRKIVSFARDFMSARWQ